MRLPSLSSCPAAREVLTLSVAPLVRGAGYTFGSGVVYKFLETNQMSHILRAHQLCMEGYTSLFDEHLSTVWSAPNYCYRCGNSASILEVSPGGQMYFNVFQAAPENERDGLSHQAAQNAGGKVRRICICPIAALCPAPVLTLSTVARVLLIVYVMHHTPSRRTAPRTRRRALALYTVDTARTMIVVH